MAENGINVLMVGGRRAGKSSMLAGLFDAMLGDNVRKLVEVEDVSGDQPNSPRLKIIELKEQLKKCVGKIVMDNKSSTDKFNPYKLKITIPQTIHSTQITFTDVNGEYYTNQITRSNADEYREQRERLLTEVRRSDVILVAIDTPFLMEGVGAQNTLVNCMEGVHDLLAELNKEEQVKLVILVPMKCEKWVKHGRADEVVSKVEYEYKDIIQSLVSPLIEVLVIPVSTVGNMEFKEFLHPYSYLENGQPLPCSITKDDAFVRFADGRTVSLTDTVEARLADDPQSVFPGTHIIRPNEWFLVTGSSFAPRNCEQLAYHILRYTLERTEDATVADNMRRRRSVKGWIGRGLLIALAISLGTIPMYIAAALVFLYGTKLGDISTAELKTLITQLSDQGLIKNAGDGIKILQKSKRIIQ